MFLLLGQFFVFKYLFLKKLRLWGSMKRVDKGVIIICLEKGLLGNSNEKVVEINSNNRVYYELTWCRW